MMAEVSLEKMRRSRRCKTCKCQHSTKGIDQGQFGVLPRPTRPSVTEASAPCRASRNLADRG